ncbi:MAG: sugar kinase [Chloroflexota bacterium]|nr:sugar kinase [Chloroflexota bacterium]
MNIPAGDLDVLSVGEAIVDLIAEQETATLEEAAHFRRFQGGAPANLAVNVAKLAGSAALIANLGSGPFSRFLQSSFHQAGLETCYLVSDPTARTSVIFISRSPGTADSVTLRDADFKLRPEHISSEAIGRARVVHTTAFALAREPCRSAVIEACKMGREQGKIVSLDPNYNPPVWPDRQEAMSVLQRVFSYVTITKPSLDDAHRLFGPGKSPEAYVDMYHAMGPELVVLTMAADGILLSDSATRHLIPANPVRVVDATGAGDAFWAGFLVALLDGHCPTTCVLFGREVAERKLSTAGPLPAKLDRQEVYRSIG